MNRFLAVCAALSNVWIASVALSESKATSPPVLVELFTSEGCSSCPPADALVAEFAKAGQVEGVPVVVLSYHVDYWDGLGWPDPFSSQQWTDEQNAAVRALNGASLYTPQMVVDGRKDLVGSNRAGATSAIRAAATSAKSTIDLKVTPIVGDVMSVNVVATFDAKQWSTFGDADIYVAVTEDNLTTDVRRGENRGKKLDHDGVVRLLKKVTPSLSGNSVQCSTVIQTPALWNVRNLHVVAFARSKTDRTVFAVGSTPFPVR